MITHLQETWKIQNLHIVPLYITIFYVDKLRLFKLLIFKWNKKQLTLCQTWKPATLNLVYSCDTGMGGSTGTAPRLATFIPLSSQPGKCDSASWGLHRRRSMCWDTHSCEWLAEAVNLGGLPPGTQRREEHGSQSADMTLHLGSSTFWPWHLVPHHVPQHKPPLVYKRLGCWGTTQACTPTQATSSSSVKWGQVITQFTSL